MHVKALNTIIHNGHTYKPGQVIEDVADADAKVLIAGGFAVESDEVPAKPQAKATKKAAEAEVATGGEGDGN